jgi:tetratricopeptide (TPR) repeat protein
LPENSNEIDPKSSKSTKGRTKESVVSSSLVAGVGMLAGLFIALPPYNADTTWRNALNSQKLENVEKALTSSYMTPSDSARLAQAVNLLEQSKLYDLSYKYARYAIEFNPNYFDAWRLLYFIKKSTEADKAEALSNLKRLDPLNPDVLALPK